MGGVNVSGLTGELGVDIGGKLTVEGTFDMTDATAASTFEAGTFENTGTITLAGKTLSTTKATLGAVSDNGTSSSTGTINFQNGRLDLVHSFNNNADSGGNPSALNISDGTLEIGGDFNQDGDLSMGSGGTLLLNGGITQAIDGRFSNTNAISGDLVVQNSSDVDPTDRLGENGNGSAVTVNGKLTIGSNSTYGTGDASAGTVSEDSDLEYNGSDFSVSGALFANRVIFAASNISGGGQTVVDGAVFGEVRIRNGTKVSVGSNNFSVVGLVAVNSGCVLEVAGTTLRLKADLQVNGTGSSTQPALAADNGTVSFEGRGASTCCSGSDLAETSNNIQEVVGTANIGFGTLLIQDDPTVNGTEQEDGNTTPETNVDFLTSASAIEIDQSVTIDEATLQSARPLKALANFKTQNNATFEFTDNSVSFTFAGGSAQNFDVVGPTDPLQLPRVVVDKTSGTATINSPVNIDSLNMVSGTLAANSTVDIANKVRLGGGNLDASGGAVTLLSPNAQNQAFVEYVDSNPDDGTLDGNVTGDLILQRSLTVGDAWYYLTSPAESTMDTFSDFLENGTGTDLRIRGVDGGDDTQQQPWFATVELWDEAESDADAAKSWKPIDCSNDGSCPTGASFDFSSGTLSYPATGTGSNMTPGRGYSVYVYNDENNDGSSEGTPKILDSRVNPRTSTSFDFVSDGPGLYALDHDSDGIEDNYDISTTSGDSEGWNLLGNPYLTPIDACAMYNSGSTSGIAPTIEIWSPGDGQNAGVDCAMTSGQEGSPFGPSALPDGNIAPNQGFMVQVTGSSPALAINDITTAQEDTSGGAFLKSAPTTSPVVLGLELAFDDHTYRTNVGFLEGRTKGKDVEDASYSGYGPADSAPSLRSVLNDGSVLVSNGLPRTLSEKTTVSLALDACDGTVDPAQALSGQAQISWPTVQNLPSTWGVTLKDTETGEQVDVRSATQYRFTHEGSCPTSKSKSTRTTDVPRRPTVGTYSYPTSKDGSGPDTRFKLVIDPDAALNSIENSMESGSFTVRTTPDKVVLENLPSPNDGANVVVQHKPAGDNAQFETLTTLSTSKSSNSYSVQKSSLKSGEHTFRLLATTKSSKRTLVEQTIGIFDEKIVVYPNPVGQEQATVNFSTTEKKDVTLTLYNTLGQRVKVLHKGEVRGSKSITVDTNSLASGVYFVRMRGDGVRATTRMTIVK